MATVSLDERVTRLEAAVQALRRVQAPASARAWWERVDGWYADVPAFAEAERLGRAYRTDDQSVTGEERDVSP